MAKGNKQVIEEEIKELQKLISWCDYYVAVNNPIEANKSQKEIEEKKKKINELRKDFDIPQRK